MKKLILIVYLFIPLLFYCQENIEYEFNRMNFFAPATQFSNAINKTSFTKSKTTVFFNENTISILVFSLLIVPLNNLLCLNYLVVFVNPF